MEITSEEKKAVEYAMSLVYVTEDNAIKCALEYVDRVGKKESEIIYHLLNIIEKLYKEVEEKEKICTSKEWDHCRVEKMRM